MTRDPLELLPLKPFVFDVLIVLVDGEQHGWGLLRRLEARLEAPVLPGQLYRQLEAMVRERLIEESEAGSGASSRRDARTGGAEPKRFFRLTPFGRSVVRAEARRLGGLVDELRAKRLLPRKGQA